MDKEITFTDVDNAAARMRQKLKEIWPKSYMNVSDDTLWELARASIISDSDPKKDKESTIFRRKKIELSEHPSGAIGAIMHDGIILARINIYEYQRRYGHRWKEKINAAINDLFLPVNPQEEGKGDE